MLFHHPSFPISYNSLPLFRFRQFTHTLSVPFALGYTVVALKLLEEEVISFASLIFFVTNALFQLHSVLTRVIHFSLSFTRNIQVKISYSQRQDFYLLKIVTHCKLFSNFFSHTSLFPFLSLHSLTAVLLHHSKIKFLTVTSFGRNGWPYYHLSCSLT